jgi:hypothetical protein
MAPKRSKTSATPEGQWAIALAVSYVQIHGRAIPQKPSIVQ